MAAAVSACTASDPRAYACTALARIDVKTRLLIHPHVVDLHTHREDGVVDAHLSAPVTADGDVEDQELRAVEWPLGIARAVVRVLVVVVIVDADGDAIRSPG